MLDNFFIKWKKQVSLLLMTMMLAHLGSADFRGLITMSDSAIEATDVTYTFSLRFSS